VYYVPGKRRPQKAASVFVALAAVLALGLIWVASAGACFGFKDVDFALTRADGLPATQAGSHPHEWNTALTRVPQLPFSDLRLHLREGRRLGHSRVGVNLAAQNGAQRQFTARVRTACPCKSGRGRTVSRISLTYDCAFMGEMFGG
jgi:hypothetical protein